MEVVYFADKIRKNSIDIIILHTQFWLWFQH